MKVREAMLKFCPFLGAVVASGKLRADCITDGCMAWVSTGKETGYCIQLVADPVEIARESKEHKESQKAKEEANVGGEEK